MYCINYLVLDKSIVFTLKFPYLWNVGQCADIFNKNLLAVVPCCSSFGWLLLVILVDRTVFALSDHVYAF